MCSLSVLALGLVFRIQVVEVAVRSTPRQEFFLPLALTPSPLALAEQQVHLVQEFIAV